MLSSSWPGSIVVMLSHSIAWMSLQLLPMVPLTRYSRRMLVFVEPRHTTSGFLSSNLSPSSRARISVRTCVYSPTTSSGQLQYPKSGISHFSSSHSRRVSVQIARCPSSSKSREATSPRQILNSMFGTWQVGQVTMARLMDERIARARGMSKPWSAHRTSTTYSCVT